MALVQLKSVTLSFGGPPLLDGVDLTLEKGERACLLGRNGSGKSTLLQIVHGTLEPDAGRVIKDPGTRIAMLDQRVPADLAGPALDIVAAGHGCLPRRPVELHVAKAALSRAGLDPEAEVSHLSAGLKRRVLIASAIASDADVLLLDEPTNHLDLASIDWLESLLVRLDRTLLFVTHDRAFLRRLSTGILDLDRGRLSRFDADYDAYLVRKQARLQTESRHAAQFDKKLAEEEAWIRQGVKERRKRNMGRVARLEEMRDIHGARRERSGTTRMEAESAARTGRRVVGAKDLTYAWDGMPIVKDLTLEIERGARLGVIGPNGSGKTTLLRLLIGELEPDSGSVRPGTNLQVAYFDQLHATLDDTKTLAENVGDGSATVTIGGKVRQVIGYLADFLFTAEQARSPITKLSGGERNRLLLARLFVRPSNVLVLDEPTNDLDVETLEVLEELITNYEGTVLFVTHDRELLDQVATQTLALDGKGDAHLYAGGYTAYLAQRPEAAAKKPAKKGKPRRAKAPKPPPALDKHERKELRELPARLEALEARQARMHAQMADPSFFQQAGDRIAKAQADLAALDAEIGAAYARWESLEAKQSGAS